MSLEFLRGFHDQEDDGLRPFRWMRREASLRVTGESLEDWFVFEVGYPGANPVRFQITGAKRIEFNLCSGWRTLAFRLGDILPAGGVISMQCEYLHAVPNENRELSLMIGNPVIGETDACALNSAAASNALFRGLVVDGYPVSTTFEVCSKCNMHCAMCIVDREMGVFSPKRDGEFGDIFEFFSEVIPYSEKIQCHATGEVFLTDAIWDALYFIKNNKCTHSRIVEIFTNGQLLNRKRRLALLQSPVTHIVFSVDAATPETYSRIRGGDFEKLLENISALVREDTHKRLVISMMMVAMRENICELPQFIRLAAKLGVSNVVYSPLFPYGVRMPVRRVSADFAFYYRQQLLMHYPRLARAMIAEAGRIAGELGVRIAETPCVLKDYDQFAQQDLAYPLPPDDFDRAVNGPGSGEFERWLQEPQERCRSCPFPWLNAFVTVDKVFSPCHYIMYAGGLESLDGKSFMDVWNGERMQAVRQGIIDGDPAPVCRASMCQYVSRVI